MDIRCGIRFACLQHNGFSQLALCTENGCCRMSGSSKENWLPLTEVTKTVCDPSR